MTLRCCVYPGDFLERIVLSESEETQLETQGFVVLDGDPYELFNEERDFGYLEVGRDFVAAVWDYAATDDLSEALNQITEVNDENNNR